MAGIAKRVEDPAVVAVRTILRKPKYFIDKDGNIVSLSTRDGQMRIIPKGNDVETYAHSVTVQIGFGLFELNKDGNCRMLKPDEEKSTVKAE